MADPEMRSGAVDLTRIGEFVGHGIYTIQKMTGFRAFPSKAERGWCLMGRVAEEVLTP